MRAFTWIETFGQDIHYGLRQLRRSPGFTTVAVLTLALGIGVNTSIFSMLNALLWRPLPVVDASEVVMLQRGSSRPSSFPDFLDLRERNTTFAGLVADLTNESALDTGDTSKVILAEAVSWDFAAVLGMRAAIGRWFSFEDEHSAEAQFPAVISHRAWQSRFGGTPNVIGKQVRLESQSYTVVGVAAEDFRGISPPIQTDIWVPVTQYALHNEFAAAAVKNRLEDRVLVLGRIRNDVTMARAQAEINSIDALLRTEYPRNDARRRELRLEIARGISDPRQRVVVSQIMALLMGVVGLVLLIACANIANLTLARGLSRRREVSVRLALGAGRARVVRQALIENLLVALFGGAAGLLGAAWANRILESSFTAAPLPIEVAAALPIDWRVIGFALIASVVTLALFGILPALEASKPNLVTGLKSRVGFERSGRRRVSLRSVHVVAQVAISFLLLVVAGLLLRTLIKSARIDPGYDAAHLLSARLYVAKPEFTETAGRELYRRVQEHVRTFPGVQDATLSYANSFINPSECVVPEGEQGAAAELSAPYNIVGSGYFSALGIPLVSGREFDERDGPNTLPVVVINETLARHYWPGQNAIGRRLRFGRDCAKGKGTVAEIVGVAKDARYASLDKQIRPYFFRPFEQHYAGYVSLLIRVSGNPLPLAATLRRELRQMEPRLRIYEVEPLEQQLSQSLWLLRWESTLLTAFGGLALVVAAIGLYGVVALTTRQRTHEIGIRMALGAQRSDVLRLVLKDGIALTLVGVALGLSLSFAFTRLLQSLLYDLSPTDALTLGVAAGLWVAIALVAGYLPARRSAKADPVAALRHE